MKSNDFTPILPVSTTPPKGFAPAPSSQEVALDLVDQGLRVAEEDLRATHTELGAFDQFRSEPPARSNPIQRHEGQPTVEEQWARPHLHLQNS